MINLAHKLPKDCYLAFSGGSDSSMLLHFALHPKRKITLVHVVYSDYEYWKEELQFVTQVATNYKLPLITHYATPTPTNTSKEAHWSKERNTLFQSLDKPVLVAHTLDDALEWFLMTSTKGDMVGKYMKVTNKNIIRPLLYTPYKKIHDYLYRHNISFYMDYSNFRLSTPRNCIRHNVIPNLVKANPGIYSSFKRNLQNANQ